MDGLIDFEELIDIQPFLSFIVDTTDSQKSSQEPISDVLDKMCKALSQSNLDLDKVLKGSEEIDEPVIDLDEFESFLATASANDCVDIDKKENIIVNDSTNTEKDNSINIQAVMPYDVPIDFEEIDPKITESVAESEKDEKPIGFLDIAVLYATNNLTSEVTEFNHKEICDNNVEESVVNLDEWIDFSPSFTEVDTDSDAGYNSSDFEFISENEAIKAGIVIKCDVKPIYKSLHDKPNITTTNSRKNEANSDYIKYSKYRYQRCYANANSEHHFIPEGEQYLDLFRGEYSPMIINNLHILKNKSVLPATAMTAETNDLQLGFLIPENEEENDEYKVEADECTKLILSTYPGENRRKRRRY